MGYMLWSDERIKEAANIEDPRRGNIVAALKTMRDDYETERSVKTARIAELEEWALAAQEVIDQGVELMPLDQFRHWTAVRAVQESYPVKGADNGL